MFSPLDHLAGLAARVLGLGAEQVMDDDIELAATGLGAAERLQELVPDPPAGALMDHRTPRKGAGCSGLPIMPPPSLGPALDSVLGRWRSRSLILPEIAPGRN